MNVRYEALECTGFHELRVQRPDKDLEGLWLEHVKTCGGCRKQELADQLLRSALSPPDLRLSDDFALILRAKLRPRRQPKKLSRSSRRLLGGYSAVSVGLSVRILFGIEWSDTVLAWVDPLWVVVLFFPALLLGASRLVHAGGRPGLDYGP